MNDKRYQIRKIVDQIDMSHYELASLLDVSETEFEDMYNGKGVTSDQYGLLMYELQYDDLMARYNDDLSTVKRPPALYLYPETRDYIKDLDDNKAGKLIKALIDYFETSEEFETDDPILRILFNGMKRKIRESIVSYNDRCKKNRQAANSRWGAKENMN